ncbi:glutaredoxin family protein [Alkalihalobacillus trypoxylicola]|uniref:glutaredoxin family protein n=1 Tax=Alkalihalobacillus trypoxylicola TaxID=519424 RepID=UPI000A6173EE|nr:glutaredoxin family protein [Alkalihalobacillus trypoxylicola]
MITVQVMSRNNCPLCTEAIAQLRNLQRDYNFELEVIDIYQDDQLLEKYQLMIPVVLVEDVEIGYGHIEDQQVISAIDTHSNKL